MPSRTDKTPCVSNPHKRGILTLAKQHGVSLRTARRIESGAAYAPEAFKDYWGKTVAARTVGKDGKSYPHQRKRYRERIGTDYHISQILTCLRQARSGVKRADAIGCEHGIDGRVIAGMIALAEQIEEIEARWSSTQQ